MTKDWNLYSDLSDRLPCRGKYCWTMEQCFREILNVSYTLDEVILFNKICKIGMIDD